MVTSVKGYTELTLTFILHSWSDLKIVCYTSSYRFVSEKDEILSNALDCLWTCVRGAPKHAIIPPQLKQRHCCRIHIIQQTYAHRNNRKKSQTGGMLRGFVLYNNSFHFYSTQIASLEYELCKNVITSSVLNVWVVPLKIIQMILSPIPDTYV